MNDLMPAIFFGHGNPMNAIYDNAYTQGWAWTGGLTIKLSGARLSRVRWSALFGFFIS